MADQKTKAAEAYVRALRSGEGSAAERAERYLAEDVVATIGSSELKGKEAVLSHITGVWPNTPVLAQGGWGDPKVSGDTAVVEAEFPSFGAGSSSATITFTFNAEDKIASVTEVFTGWGRPEPVKEIPLVVRGLINSALFNNLPMTVAYVDGSGKPHLSLRGSVQVFGPTQLCAWLRDAEGGLTKALASNPQMALLFRDSRTRSTLVINGNGRIDSDPEVRDRVFELGAEVEQNHDPSRTGAALIIDVTEIRGGTPKGPVWVQP